MSGRPTWEALAGQFVLPRLEELSPKVKTLGKLCDIATADQYPILIRELYRYIVSGLTAQQRRGSPDLCNKSRWPFSKQQLDRKDARMARLVLALLQGAKKVGFSSEDLRQCGPPWTSHIGASPVKLEELR